MAPTILIVPGLRGHVPEHWQTHLNARMPGSQIVWPLGGDNLDCSARIEALDLAAGLTAGPIVVVAHSGGVPVVAHWAHRTKRRDVAALLATPPNIERPMPEGYPTIEQLDRGGWLPLPRAALPFNAIVAASRNDPLATFEWTAALARDWGADLEDLGEVGHLNPASGFGPWPYAQTLIDKLGQSLTVC